MALFIAAYLPDRQLDDTAFNKALIRVAAALARHRQQAPQTSGPHIDLHFLLPGKTERPQFTGMRLHSFDNAAADSKAHTLHIESAVPAHMLDSTHAEAYIFAVMQDAIDNASGFFNSQLLGPIPSQHSEFRPADYFDLIDKLTAPSTQLLN